MMTYSVVVSGFSIVINRLQNIGFDLSAETLDPQDFFSLVPADAVVLAGGGIVQVIARTLLVLGYIPSAVRALPLVHRLVAGGVLRHVRHPALHFAINAEPAANCASKFDLLNAVPFVPIIDREWSLPEHPVFTQQMIGMRYAGLTSRRAFASWQREVMVECFRVGEAINKTAFFT